MAITLLRMELNFVLFRTSPRRRWPKQLKWRTGCTIWRAMREC